MLKRAAYRWRAFGKVTRYASWGGSLASMVVLQIDAVSCINCENATTQELRQLDLPVNFGVELCKECHSWFLDIYALFPTSMVSFESPRSCNALIKAGDEIYNALAYGTGDVIVRDITCDEPPCCRCNVCGYFSFGFVTSWKWEKNELPICSGCITLVRELAATIDKETIGRAVVCIHAVSGIAGNKDVAFYLSSWIAKVMTSDRAILDAYNAVRAS